MAELETVPDSPRSERPFAQVLEVRPYQHLSRDICGCPAVLSILKGSNSVGTKRTCSRISPRSDVKGRPEVVGAIQNDEIDLT